MKKTLFILLTASALCLAVCKTEPDLPADPHVPLVNPFVGVWRATTGGQYWEFRPDGTGGKAASADGPFGDSFSFFVYAGQDVRTAPKSGSLLLLEDSTNDSVSVTRYTFSSATEYWATLTPVTGGENILLERESVNTQVLNVANSLVGEWSASWSWPGGDHDYGTWSLKYRADGTLRLYHHQVQHQFENAYALRKNTLVIFGDMRFSSPQTVNSEVIVVTAVTAGITPLGNGQWHVQETQSTPGPANWTYTKVNAAKWK